MNDPRPWTMVLDIFSHRKWLRQRRCCWSTAAGKQKLASMFFRANNLSGGISHLQASLHRLCWGTGGGEATKLPLTPASAERRWESFYQRQAGLQHWRVTAGLLLPPFYPLATLKLPWSPFHPLNTQRSFSTHALWNALPLDLLVTGSFWSCESQLKWHLLRKVFPAHQTKQTVSTSWVKFPRSEARDEDSCADDLLWTHGLEKPVRVKDTGWDFIRRIEAEPSLSLTQRSSGVNWDWKFIWTHTPAPESHCTGLAGGGPCGHTLPALPALAPACEVALTAQRLTFEESLMLSIPWRVSICYGVVKKEKWEGLNWGLHSACLLFRDPGKKIIETSYVRLCRDVFIVPTFIPSTHSVDLIIYGI